MPNLLFLYLKAFSITGGIEKVNRVLMKALYEMQLQQLLHVTAASPYAVTGTVNERYFPANQLIGYSGRRWRFMLAMLFGSLKVDTVFVAHINLSVAIRLLKWRRPKLKIIAIAHGIEVWGAMPRRKKWLLEKADRIITVSRFTKDKLVEVQGISADKITVLPNCLDPYFEPPQQLDKPHYLLERHGLRPDQKILLTITRLNVWEAYKGYDNILECIPELRKKWPDLVYLIGGKYEDAEKQRLDEIINRLGIAQNVRIMGFIPDEELTDYYRFADVFVMPSKKEGFGLVFIEAMACGTPAIGGNLDGSIEALQPGVLGEAVNPDDQTELCQAISSALYARRDAVDLQRKVLDRFHYDGYRTKLAKIIREVHSGYSQPDRVKIPTH